jgi:hypothetical protein
MEAADFSRILIRIYQTPRHHNSEDSILQHMLGEEWLLLSVIYKSQLIRSQYSWKLLVAFQRDIYLFYKFGNSHLIVIGEMVI